jgi:hypothetical protein
VRISSRRPKVKTPDPHNMSGKHRDRNVSQLSTVDVIPQVIKVAANIPTPPRRAVSFLCHRLSFGTATQPFKRASFLIIGVKIRDAKNPALKRIR